MLWFGPCAGWSCLSDVAPSSDYVELRSLSSYTYVAQPAPPGLYAARHRVTNDLVALKVLDKRLLRQRPTRRRLRQEVRVLQLAHGHSHLLQLHDVSTSGTRVELAFELATGGEVLPKLRSERDVSRVIAQVASGLQFLHERGVVHGEVRPEHVLFSEDDTDARVLLAAFGRAAPWKNLSLRCRPRANGFLWDNVHHIHFLPPFVLKKRRDPKWKYGDGGVVTNWREAQQIDVWALGVTLYVMLCGCFPFSDGVEPGKPDNVVDIEKRVLKDRLTFPHNGTLLTRAARDLLRRMLEKNADAAMRIEEIVAHPWLNGAVAPPVSWNADMQAQHQAFAAKYAEEVAAASHRRPMSASSFCSTLGGDRQAAAYVGLETAAGTTVSQVGPAVLKRDTLELEAEEEEARPSFMSTHGTPLLLDEEGQQERLSADCFMRLASLEMGGNNMNTNSDDDDVVEDPGTNSAQNGVPATGANAVDGVGKNPMLRQTSLDKMWQVLLRQRRFFSSKSLSSGSSTDRS